jgi:hypothetical protein
MMMKQKRMKMKWKKLIAAMINRRVMDIIATRIFLFGLESLLSTLSIYRDKNMKSKCR